MVEINLIKERYIIPVRRRERLFFSIGVFLPILLFSLAVLGIVHSVNKTVISNYSSRIEKQEKALEEEQERIISPTSEEKNYREELKKIAAFQDKRLLLTPKLVVLADAIPSLFYLNKIDFDGNKLTLEGQGLPGNKTDTSLAVFLEKMNGNENFIRGLKEFRLEEIKEEAGIINFRAAGIKQ